MIGWLSDHVIPTVRPCGCSHKQRHCLRESATQIVHNDSRLKKLNIKPTRGRGTTNPNILYLIFKNNEHLIDVAYISPHGKNDHRMLYFDAHCSM